MDRECGTCVDGRMTYRDDLQAARMRRDALARELHQVRGRMGEFDGLARQAGALERELAECSRDMDRARARVELPLLQRVRVASPCKERWDDMAGDEHVRFCGRCEKNVYDLSSLSASQAEALLQEKGEAMCARFFRRSDGTILTSDCPVGARRKSTWRRVTGAAVATGLAAAGMALAGATLGVQELGGMEPQVLEEHVEEVAGGLSFEMSQSMALGAREGEAEELDRQMGDAQNRLAAATTAEEKQAARQQLDALRAEAMQKREEIRQLRQHAP
jgi:hypothetical protein